MMHNIFVPDVATAKSTIESFLKSDKVNVNVFVVTVDGAKEILSQLNTINGNHLTVAPIMHVDDVNEYVGKRSKTQSKKVLPQDLRDKYVQRLAGEEFWCEREGIRAGVSPTASGKFRCLNTNTDTHKAPNGPFRVAWSNKIKGHPALNAWTGPKDTNGKSLDDRIREIMSNDAQSKGQKKIYNAQSAYAELGVIKPSMYDWYAVDKGQEKNESAPARALLVWDHEDSEKPVDLTTDVKSWKKRYVNALKLAGVGATLGIIRASMVTRDNGSLKAVNVRPTADKLVITNITETSIDFKLIKG